MSMQSAISESRSDCDGYLLGGGKVEEVEKKVWWTLKISIAVQCWHDVYHLAFQPFGAWDFYSGRGNAVLRQTGAFY